MTETTTQVERLQLVRQTLIRERQKIRDVIETYREFPDDFHVLDGKQGGLFQAIQIIDPSSTPKGEN